MSLPRHYRIAAPLLFVGSLCFHLGVKVRNFLYDKGIWKSKKSSVFVVSVGNVVAGGVGKTPFTLLLAQELLPFMKVAIVSRGYKAEAEKKKDPLIVSRGEGPLLPPEVCGDEPYLLAQNVPSAIVVAGKNRLKGAEIAKKLGASVVLLDDGMQHRQLARDLEIVVLNGEDRYGQDHFLPRGFLRDEPKRIQKADLIVSSKGEEGVVLEDKLTASHPLDHVKVGAFCGIAQPARFIKSLIQLNALVVDTYFVSDHNRVKKKDLLAFSKRAKEKGASFLVCTEKDFVKLEKSWELPLPLAWVKKEVRVKKNRKLFSDAIERIKEGCRA